MAKQNFLRFLFCQSKKTAYLCTRKSEMICYTVDVVQLVRASDCGSECRGFEPHPPPSEGLAEFLQGLFLIEDNANG